MLPDDRPAGTDRPVFEVGRVYNRRADIHRPFGGQQQGGISTFARVPCIFLFTSPSGAQHGYADGWTDEGVFRYTGEGQAGEIGRDFLKTLRMASKRSKTEVCARTFSR